jgi:hypothetical protein
MLVVFGILKVAAQSDSSYKHVGPHPDVERRCQPLGNASEDKLLDLTAFAAMPDAYSEAASKYIEAVVAAIKAEPIKRRRFYEQARALTTAPEFSFPDKANPVFDRDVVVPLVLLPRPAAVKTWSASSKGRSLGWRTEGSLLEPRGSVYGRTLIFEPGKLSKNPMTLPALPLGTETLYTWDLYVPPYDTSFFLKLGKLVLRAEFDFDHGDAVVDRSADLHLGEQDGARLLGEFVTVPAHLKNSRLRWAAVRDGSGVRQFLAYALFDGNGARRWPPYNAAPNSPYVRPLVCERHQPVIKAHDELLLPTPSSWPPTYKEREYTDFAHEEWCLDDWFPAQREACWVIREAEDSKPLQESFLLMSASEPSNRPVFFVALFGETEPKQLVQELADLFKVSPNATLDSPETMARLHSLYEDVKNFPLAP